MRFFLCIFFFGLSWVNAQDFVIMGKVVDSIFKFPLESATIHAETVKDSALVTYTVTDQEGFFELIGNTKHKEVDVFFSYNGYRPIKKRIALKPNINLDTVFLKEQAEELDAVVIVGIRSPITIKKDTMEFNANSFKTRPDADVEDLLKKLPGVDMDDNGNLTINGKTVDKILVGGKPFFGDDPKVALKNLTKDLVDKIQVMDTKTDLEEFTGKKSTSENKTINIELKKDKNKGVYGRLYGGLGTNDRYQATGIVNFFDDQKRLSILGGGNNLDMPGFSNNELSDMVSSYFGNSGDGISESYDVGASYVDHWGNKKDLAASYYHTNESRDNNRIVERENILPDRRFFANSKYDYHSKVRNRTGRTTFKFRIDSTTKVTISPYYRYSFGESGSVSENESLDENAQLTNNSSVVNSSESNNKRFTNRISILKRFRPKGSYFMVDFRNQNRKNKSRNNRHSIYNIYGDNPQTVDENEQINNAYKLNEWRFETEYRRPLAKHLNLSLNYYVSNTKEQTDKDVLDFDPSTNSFENFDAVLSADYVINRKFNRPLVRLSFDNEKLYTSFTTSFVNVTLDNRDFMRNANFTKKFNDITVNGRLRYKIKEGGNVSLRYYTRSRVPSVAQLQPVPNVNNPLNVVTGNPDLKRAYSYHTSAAYDDYNIKRKSGFHLSGSYGTTNDEVVSISTTDEDLLRETTYTNVDGNRSGNLRTHFHKSIKRDSSTFRMGMGVSSNYRKHYNFSNAVKFSTETVSVGPGMSFSYYFKELLDLDSRYSVNFNNNKYSIARFGNQNFVFHYASVRTTTYWPRNFILASDIRYSYNPSIADGFEKGSMYWNMSMSLKVMDDNGIIKLKVYDLLDQQNSTRRIVTGDYVESSQNLVLNQYFILGFTYKLNTLAAKAAKKRSAS